MQRKVGKNQHIIYNKINLPNPIYPTLKCFDPAGPSSGGKKINISGDYRIREIMTVTVRQCVADGE